MNKKINRIIIGIFLFLGALYIGGSLSQYAVGDRSKEFLLLITGSIIITNLVAIIEYKRNKLSKTIPWIYSIIYCIIYSITLLTTKTVVTYVIAFVYIISIILCKNEKWFINTPITPPIIRERIYPIAPRSKLFPIADSKVPCFIISVNEFHTPIGDGIA